MTMSFLRKLVSSKTPSRVPLIGGSPTAFPESLIISSALVMARTYAVPAAATDTSKKAKVTASGARRKDFSVESNPYKLQEYCCGSNIYITGEDVKLKPESEYPDWLWDIHIGPPLALEELDPNSKEYWVRVRKLTRQHKNRLHKLRTKILKMF